MRGSIRSWLVGETVVFWATTLVVCAAVGVVGYQLGRDFVGRYLSSESQPREFPQPPGRGAPPKPIAPKSLAPQVIVLDREPTTAERLEYETEEAEAASDSEHSAAEPPAAQEPAASQPTAEEAAGQPPAEGQEEPGESGGAAESAAADQGGTPQTRAEAAAGPQWIATAGSYRDRTNAEQVAASLGAEGMRVRIIPVTVRGQKFHRVVVGPFDSREDATAASERVQAAGYPSQVMKVR